MNSQNWENLIFGKTEIDKSKVIHFFCCEIRGVCDNNEKPKNIKNLEEIIKLDEWYEYNLKKDAFGKLSIPDNPRVLLNNKNICSIKNDSYWKKKLEDENQIPFLILKLPDPLDADDSSFGILDGSSRAQTYFQYLTKQNKWSQYSLKIYLGLKTR